MLHFLHPYIFSLYTFDSEFKVGKKAEKEKEHKMFGKHLIDKEFFRFR